MIKKISILFGAIGILFLASCNLDLLDNPNAVNSSTTDLNYLLNKIQVDYATHFNNLSGPGMRLTRMLNQGAAIYDNAVTPSDNDFTWSNAYAGILADVNALIPLAEKGEQFQHAGVARIVRASVLFNLVDAFGDVPYSAALNAENFNPKTDPGADVYAAALADLDKGIANLAAKSKAGLSSDLYFATDVDKWTRLANTLKLKAQLNRRLVDKAGATTAINALIAGNKLISASAQNFVFKFGTSQTNPDTRHPRYGAQYSATGSGDYQSNSYMGTMFSAKGFVDPRMRYYFYRQTIKNSSDVNQIRCIGNQKPNHYAASDVYCYPTTIGYWGRDHLSNEGIPPDGLLRTAWGLYPAGGLYDDDAGKGVSLAAGAGGAGIHPILTQSFVDFMLAESALTLGTTGDAKALLKSAIEKSMADVRAFVMGTTEAGKITAFETSKSFVWATEVTTYVNKVLADYDAATTADAKLNIIGTEYWIALRGNGIEAYNLYRRTGKPGNQQPGLDPNSGGFVRSYYYPAAFVSRNSSAKQKTAVTTPVFWDNNPASMTK
jgi:Starch-binding associating with outer membrane/Susd and RagB outer membrane lipoprotein